MILIYPEKYKENAPEYVDILFYPEEEKYKHTMVEDNGFYDTFILKVGHFNGADELEYRGWKELNKNIHYYMTSIDCRYKSKNLDVLIDKIKNIEKIWNNE